MSRKSEYQRMSLQIQKENRKVLRVEKAQKDLVDFFDALNGGF